MSSSPETGVSETVVNSVSGSLASVLALLATYPLKTIYTLQSLSTGNEGGGSASALQIARRAGLSGLYVAIEPNVIESALSSGVYFYLYAALKEYALSISDRKASSSSSSDWDTSAASLRSPSNPGSPVNGKHPHLITDKSVSQNSSHNSLPYVCLPAPKNSGQALASCGSAGALSPGAAQQPPHPVNQTPVKAPKKDLGMLATFLIPLLAATGNQLLTMPASVVATQMQAQKRHLLEGKSARHPPPPQLNMTQVINRIFEEGGMGGFWSGLLPSLVLVCNPTVQYMLYEQLVRMIKRWKTARLAKKQVAQQEGTDSSSSAADQDQTTFTSKQDPTQVKAPAPLPSVKLAAWEVFMASALAKIGATVATYWLVVVKSRLQAASKGASGEPQYRGTMDALQRIWSEEGPGGFFKGLKAKILQTALNAALMLMLKEELLSGTRKMLNALVSFLRTMRSQILL